MDHFASRPANESEGFIATYGITTSHAGTDSEAAVNPFQNTNRYVEEYLSEVPPKEVSCESSEPPSNDFQIGINLLIHVYKSHQTSLFSKDTLSTDSSTSLYGAVPEYPGFWSNDSLDPFYFQSPLRLPNPYEQDNITSFADTSSLPMQVPGEHYGNFNPISHQSPFELPNPFKEHDVAKLAEAIKFKLHELDRDELSYLKDVLQDTLHQVDSITQQTPSTDLLTPPSSTISTRPQWVCKLCPVKQQRNFRTLGIFKRHVAYIHAHRYTYHCPFCSWSSPRKDKVIEHARSRHGNTNGLTDKLLHSMEEEAPAPANCPLCSQGVDSWDSFFSCLANHCLLAEDEDQLESTKPLLLDSAIGITPSRPYGTRKGQKRKTSCEPGQVNADADGNPVYSRKKRVSISLDHPLPNIDNKNHDDDGHREKRIRQEQNTDMGACAQSSWGDGSPQTGLRDSQTTGEIYSTNGADDVSTKSSMRTDITTPEAQEVVSIDEGIIQPNDLSCVLDAPNHYQKLDDLELETARICGMDQGLELRNRHSQFAECVQSLHNIMNAFNNLQAEGFCGDLMNILVEYTFQPDIATTVHISSDQIKSLIDSFCGNDPVATSRIFLLADRLRGVDDFKESRDLESELSFICSVLCIGLLSFSGSHVCRFDIKIAQPTENISVGLGYSFRLRKLACLSDFVGGPAWVLCRSESQPSEHDMKVSLTVQDFQELWGPVWMLGDSPDEGPVLRTERGYVVPLSKQGENRTNAQEIECHWTRELPESFMQQDHTPIFRSTSRILIGTDTPKIGLVVNHECQSDISLIAQRIACKLQLPGATKAYFVDGGYEINLTGGQYVTAGVTKKWKRMPARTQRTALLELCSKSNTPLIPLLRLQVGLEVSACTGNAQRVALWDALRLSRARVYDSSENDICPYLTCEHNIGDIQCIKSCWIRHRPADEIDAVDYSPKKGSLDISEARRLIIDSILVLEHTGIDNEGNLQAWWPFSDSPLTCRISPTSSDESNNWFRVVKDTRDMSAFAVLSQRCLGAEEMCVRQCSGSHKNGYVRANRTGLCTRFLSADHSLACLKEGTKLHVGAAPLTVERPLGIYQIEAMIVAVSTNPIRRIMSPKVTSVQEVVDYNNQARLSVPVLIR
ncbi:ZnF_C2H2 [Aspergillus sclerotialis]|uniref:ZnF_C2H2 n=1 Tax=Aspergillus sclerotialis TaxID=2070753 RepID=A0A3A2Z9K6_9EURO|nr:ZnF_C2H2 [Aspergillus sclerotialis]